MPVPADLLIILVVLAALWTVYRLVGYRPAQGRTAAGTSRTVAGTARLAVAITKR